MGGTISLVILEWIYLPFMYIQMSMGPEYIFDFRRQKHEQGGCYLYLEAIISSHLEGLF